MKRYSGNGDIGSTYLNNKEILKSDIILDFRGELLNLINSINLLMLTNTIIKKNEIKLELSKIIETIALIVSELECNKSESEYRISSHKYLEELIDSYDKKLNGKKKNNFLSCKDGCLARDCFLKASRVERLFYKLNMEALYSTYLNRLCTYFDVLRQYIDEENGF